MHPPQTLSRPLLRGAAITMAASVLLLAPLGAHTAEVCSAWAEPARVAVQMRLREQHRMRSDRAWVGTVARNPQSRFDYANILMAPDELAEFRQRMNKMMQGGGAARQAMIQQAQAYAAQHPEQFAGLYLRRTSDFFLDPPVALVLKFKGNLSVHTAALQDLPRADIPLEILPARFSMKQLEETMELLQRRYASLPDGGDIQLLGYGPDVQENVIEVRAESNASDAAARLVSGYGDMVRAVVHPLRGDSQQADVTQGAAWRLLGRAERRGTDPSAEGTQLATSEGAWRALREANDLPPPLQPVDFRRQVVLTFTQSIGCGTTLLQDLVIDRELRSIEPRFTGTGSPRRACALPYVGYEVFAVAIERAALPVNPITVPTGLGDFQNPAYCPRGLVIAAPPPNR